MLICMDLFILFVDDHRIALDEIDMEFSLVPQKEKEKKCYPTLFCVTLLDDAILLL